MARFILALALCGSMSSTRWKASAAASSRSSCMLTSPRPESAPICRGSSSSVLSMSASECW